jgi:DNA-binding CsgD family transcriptional regulator
MVSTALGAKGATAEAAIISLCLDDLAPLELFERAAIPFRRAVPYDASCWKPMDPRTLLFTGFGIEDPEPGRLAAVAWRFVENELLEPDYAKFRDLVRRRTPVTTLGRETHGEPDRSARYRHIHRSLGFGAELRAAFRTGDACWGSVALVRNENESDFSDDEIEFVARAGSHLAHGLRHALLRQAASEGMADRAPGVIVLDADGSVCSLTGQASFWLERFPRDRGTGLELPAAVHAVARRALRRAGSAPFAAYASVRLLSGEWLTIHAAPLHTDRPDHGTVAVTLAPAAVADLLPLRLHLHGLTPREREVAQLLTRGAGTDEVASALFISPHTVKDHVKAVLSKVGVTSRTELSAKLFHEHVVSRLDNQRAREFALMQPAA